MVEGEKLDIIKLTLSLSVVVALLAISMHLKKKEARHIVISVPLTQMCVNVMKRFLKMTKIPFHASILLISYNCQNMLI